MPCVWLVKLGYTSRDQGAALARGRGHGGEDRHRESADAARNHRHAERPHALNVPVTVTLYEAQRAMDVVREGYVVLDHVGRGETGRAKHEAKVVKRLMERVCRKAGLPESGWHQLRHSVGTHAARSA